MNHRRGGNQQKDCRQRKLTAPSVSYQERGIMTDFEIVKTPNFPPVRGRKRSKLNEALMKLKDGTSIKIRFQDMGAARRRGNYSGQYFRQTKSAFKIRTRVIPEDGMFALYLWKELREVPDGKDS